MTGTRGRTAGNALGVLGLLFAGMESGLGYLNDGSVPDAAATVAAGQFSVHSYPGILLQDVVPHGFLDSRDVSRDVNHEHSVWAMHHASTPGAALPVESACC